MGREESGSGREHHLPPVKGESAIRFFVRPLHRHFPFNCCSYCDKRLVFYPEATSRVLGRFHALR
jgi:hypothetical protein